MAGNGTEEIITSEVSRALGQLGYSTASGPTRRNVFLEATALQQAATIAVAMGLLLLSIPNGRICSRDVAGTATSCEEIAEAQELQSEGWAEL